MNEKLTVIIFAATVLLTSCGVPKEVMQKIKAEIKKLQKTFPDVKSERMEFDLAKIFHSNLRELGFGRFNVDDVGMWRWMSMNYFKEETFWRRGKSDFDKRDSDRYDCYNVFIYF